MLEQPLLGLRSLNLIERPRELAQVLASEHDEMKVAVLSDGLMEVLAMMTLYLDSSLLVVERFVIH
jgi:hypothetical protein